MNIYDDFTVEGFIPANAEIDLQDEYSQGNCHTFALAVHRATGWPMLAVVDDCDIYWCNENDPSDHIPAVTHVYVVTPDQNALDIFGTRPIQSVVEECENRWSFESEPTSIFLQTEADLNEYVGTWGITDDGDPITRPLPAHSEEEIARATEVAYHLYTDILRPYNSSATNPF